jgi:hypothetical protein
VLQSATHAATLVLATLVATETAASADVVVTSSATLLEQCDVASADVADDELAVVETALLVSVADAAELLQAQAVALLAAAELLLLAVQFHLVQHQLVAACRMTMH